MFHFCWFVCLFVCLRTRLLEKLWTDFHGILWIDWYMAQARIDWILRLMWIRIRIWTQDQFFHVYNVEF